MWCARSGATLKWADKLVVARLSYGARGSPAVWVGTYIQASIEKHRLYGYQASVEKHRSGWGFTSEAYLAVVSRSLAMGREREPGCTVF